MKSLSERQRLNILLALGGLVVAAIILVPAFGFDMNNNHDKEKIGFIILGDINSRAGTLRTTTE